MTKLYSPVVRPPVQTEKQRSIPHVSRPSSEVIAPTGQISDTFSYFTKADGVEYQLYTGDRPWVQVKLLLETAGPVAVATKQKFTPVLSGAGRLLPTGGEVAFTLPKGKVLWIASTSINRVSVTIEPFAWLEQIYAADINEQNATRELIHTITQLPGAIAQSIAQFFGRRS